MEEKLLFSILNDIRRCGKVQSLGDYKIYNESFREELLEHSEDIDILTEKGINIYNLLKIKYKNVIDNNISKDKWIEEDLKRQITKIDKDFIFLPRRDEFTF